MAAFSFNANQVPVNNGTPPPVPKGRYRMVLVESEIKPTSSGEGAFIEAQFKIIQPPHEGHVVYHNFNIRNQSQKAMQIGYGQLSALSHAVGILNWQDTTQLHNRPFMADLKIGGGGEKPGGGTYDERNEITSFHPDGATLPGAVAPAPNFTPPAPVQVPQPVPVAQPQFSQPVAATPQPWEQQPQPAPAGQLQPWEQQHAPIAGLQPAAQPAPSPGIAPAPGAAPLPWMTPTS